MEENTEDNQTLEDLYKSLAEVRTTNRFILRRLNHVVDSGMSGTCCCTRTKPDDDSEETYISMIRLANIETKQVETANAIKDIKQQLTEIQNVVKELQENQYVTENTPAHSFETNPVKGMLQVGEYETIPSLTSIEISIDNCKKHNNKEEIEKSLRLDSNNETEYSSMNEEQTLKSSNKCGNAAKFETTREKEHSATVLQNDASDEQLQLVVTSDTATVVRAVQTDVERNENNLSTADVDKIINKTEVEIPFASSGTTGSVDEKHTATVLKIDANEQQAKSFVMSETAIESATEALTTDCNRSTCTTVAELNNVDTSLYNNALADLADDANTATFIRKDDIELKAKHKKDESGDGGTRAVDNVFIEDRNNERNISLNSDNVTSKPKNTSNTSLKVNENDWIVKPEKCTSGDKTNSPKQIKKPNFDRGRSSINARGNDLPVVLKQNQKKFYEDHKFWDFLGEQELREARNSGLIDSDGAHTVLCIDISFSMSRDDAWKHVTTFLNSYIGGLEEVARNHGFKDEHVALVTFGHDTRVIQRFTNDMSKIRTTIGNIKLGGPSPMYGGLEMSICAAESAKTQMGNINGIPVPTKIVLITDGELTDTCLYQGPDEAEINKMEETKTHVLSKMESYQPKPSINFFCMTAGNTYTDFLQLMTGVANVKMIRYIDGGQFARRSYLMSKLDARCLMSGPSSSDPMGLFSQMSGQSGPDKEDMSLSTQDKEQIEDIKKETQALMDRTRNSVVVQQVSMYLDPNSSKLPAVGALFIRGPDGKYYMQDSNGPGTVTGQLEGGLVLRVERDADVHTDVYRYSAHDNCDLLIVDEPRNVTDGKLAVGCRVRPGKDFQYSDPNVGPNERGVAIKINQAKQTVMVEWSNTERGEYKYSDNRQGKMEVEMWSSSSPSKKQQQNVFAPERAKKSPYRNKNKNT